MAEAEQAAPVEIKGVDNSKPKERLPLQESRFHLSEFKQNRWTVFPPPGTVFEDLLDRKFWAHVAGKVKETDIVFVIAEDGSWIAEMYCAAAYGQALDLRALPGYPLKVENSRTTDSPYSLYEIKYAGPVHKWQVSLKDGDRVLKSGLQSEGAAQAYLNDLIKANKRAA